MHNYSYFLFVQSIVIAKLFGSSFLLIVAPSSPKDPQALPILALMMVSFFLWHFPPLAAMLLTATKCWLALPTSAGIPARRLECRAV